LYLGGLDTYLGMLIGRSFVYHLEWTYPCQLSKEHPKWWQWKILDFEGNKLTTIISQFADRHYDCRNNTIHRLYQVKIEADIVLGKVINKGAANEHTQIGIKTTKIQIKLDSQYFGTVIQYFNEANFYNTSIGKLRNDCC
jgi:hypothetical protein